VAQIPLAESTFDQFFNGRSGYRAQYYLSPEEGILYNRDTLDRLVHAIEIAYSRSRGIEWKLVKESIHAPHAKVWVFQDEAAFNHSLPNVLNPPRWVDNATGNKFGLRTPLPDHRKIDIKGSFIQQGTSALFVASEKLDRACDLFNRGYT
jgi:hypothetical protein